MLEIDGPEGILGGAAPTPFPIPDGLPLHGLMEFDADDAQTQPERGTWGDLGRDEMLHVVCNGQT